MQSTTPAATTTEAQTPQPTDSSSSQPTQRIEIQSLEQFLPAQSQSAAGASPRTSRTSVSGRDLPLPSSHALTVRNHNGQLTATPDASGVWHFTFTGTFAQQQQSYVLDFGDGTQTTLQCVTPAPDGHPACDQFAPVSHTYTESGPHQVALIETFVGAGNEGDSTLLSVTVPDGSGAGAPASDTAPPAAPPLGAGSGGGMPNTGPSTNSGDGSSSHVKDGCTFVSNGGDCISITH